MKKKWEKPELIVLLRGKPEEVLQSNCKNVGALTFARPLVDSQGCGEGTGNCGVCHPRGGGGT